MIGDAHLRDAHIVFPFPIPKRDPDTWGVTYAPVVGNTQRRFRSMNDACDYQVGARARILNLGLHGEANAFTREGWADQDRLIAEHALAVKREADQRMTFMEYMGKRAAVRRQTFDAALSGVSQ
jgi:hypothetical protein